MIYGGGKINKTAVGALVVATITLVAFIIYAVTDRKKTDSINTKITALQETDVKLQTAIPSNTTTKGLFDTWVQTITLPSVDKSKVFKVGSFVSYRFDTSLGDFGAYYANRSAASGTPDTTAIAYGTVKKLTERSFLTKKVTYAEVLWDVVDVLNGHDLTKTSNVFTRSTDEAWNAKYLGVLSSSGTVVPPTVSVELPVVLPLQHLSLLETPADPPTTPAPPATPATRA
jgi:hypothetical protein